MGFSAMSGAGVRSAGSAKGSARNETKASCGVSQLLDDLLLGGGFEFSIQI